VRIENPNFSNKFDLSKSVRTPTAKLKSCAEENLQDGRWGERNRKLKNDSKLGKQKQFLKSSQNKIISLSRVKITGMVENFEKMNNSFFVTFFEFNNGARQMIDNSLVSRVWFKGFRN
jgi:hypothetical protein